MNINFVFPLSLHKFCYEKQYITEQGGVRPVVIIQNDIGNKFSTTVIAAITGKRKKAKLPTHVLVDSDDYLPKDSIIMLEQIRTIDKKRLVERISQLNDEIMSKVEDALYISVGYKQNY